nr:probable peroxygenase 5 [Ipomoea batatas]
MLVGGDLGLGILVAAFLGLIGPLLGFLVRRKWRHAVTRREEIDWLLVLASKATRAEFEVTGETVVEVEKAFQELLSAKRLPVMLFRILRPRNELRTTGSQDRVVWERIWKLKTPHKMLTLLWMLKHERVMCNVQRKKREFTSYAYCDKCRDKEEDVDHVFRRWRNNAVFNNEEWEMERKVCWIFQQTREIKAAFSKDNHIDTRTTQLAMVRSLETIQGHGWEALAAELRWITPQKENAVISIVHLGGHGEKITHIHRDHNRVANRLARIAVREGRDWIEFGAPPNDAREYYEEDRLGALEHNGKWPSPLFPIVVKNIKHGKHGSDTGAYDSEGKFVPSKFEEIFKKHARIDPNALTSAEVDELLRDNREPKDYLGCLLDYFGWDFHLWFRKYRYVLYGLIVLFGGVFRAEVWWWKLQWDGFLEQSDSLRVLIAIDFQGVW